MKIGCQSILSLALSFDGGLLEWLRETVAARLSWRGVMWGFLIFLFTFTLSLAITAFVIVKLPATYFQATHERQFWAERHPVLRWTGIILKNLLGVVLVLLGIVMTIGPGQGLLTILLGVMLLDFPGKRNLELRLVSRSRVFSAINLLRARFDKPPLVLDELPPALT